MNETKYYTSREISLHVTIDDLWVSLFGRVLDLSPMCSDMIDRDDEIFPLLTFAGKDISHLFDETGEVKIHVDPNTNKISPFLPFMTFPGVMQKRAEKLFWHRRQLDEKKAEALMLKYRSQKLGLSPDPSKISEVFSTNEELNDVEELPWWKDDKYVIGLFTKKPRWIKILNTMIMKEVVLEVCSEDSIERILERYLKHNCHARSYTWKYMGEALVMEQTLEMNGIPDREEELDRLKINSDDFIPTLTLYFNHDLTEM